MDCKQDFHRACYKMSKADIVYVTSKDMVWRCEPCATTSHISLRLESRASVGSLSLQDVIKAIDDLKGEQWNTLKEFNYSYEVLNSKIDEDTLKQNTVKMAEYIKIIETHSRKYTT